MNAKGLSNASKYKIQPAENINLAISQLPKGELVNIIPVDYIAEADKVSKFKGVRVRDNLGNVEYVQVCGKDYKLIQHAEAFRPIIEGLTIAGNKDFMFSLTSNFKHASLNVYSGQYGYDGVTIGWNILNSFAGHTSLKYGLNIDLASQYIELVGYRQVCANGMIIKVPLNDAEIIQPEIIKKVSEKIAEATFYFRHTGNVMERIKTVQYLAEALELLVKPMEALIKKAENVKLEDKDAIKKMIMQHIGKRYYSRVNEQFNSEASDLWGLYNAVTYVASHEDGLTDSARELLLNKASTMLLKEL